MIVVSDTSPVNYLLAIGQIDLLPRLFGRIVLPAAGAHLITVLKMVGTSRCDVPARAAAGGKESQNYRGVSR